MSVDNKTQTEGLMLGSEPKALEEALGSHYALQVAHQTMKERCQQLQLSLANLEEKNLQLRISKSEYPSYALKKELLSTPEVKQLQDKVDQLTHEKAQLVQINYMVATENRKLWSRLSRLTQANQSLGSHLTKISDTLSQHDANDSINAEAKQILSIAGKTTCLLADADKKVNQTANHSTSNSDIKDQSLEEISLKLISSFLQGKEELEEQYAQMVEIQRGTSLNIHEIGFNYLEEDESSVTEIAQHYEKLQEMKNTLVEQQQLLKASVENLSRIKRGVRICHQCQQKLFHGEHSSENSTTNEDKLYASVHFGESLNEELQQQLRGVVEPPEQKEHLQSNNSLDIASLENDTESHGANNTKQEDRICPMCGKFYPKRIQFDDFQKHVLNHFSDDSDPVLDNFEVIT